MAYQELIKNFDKIRNYMREFYVYGFRTRSDFGERSGRSYDDERRRVESWLGDYMSFRQDASGRRFFLSVDGREIPENPLYEAFKTCSFTANDITLHFNLLDLLADGARLTGSELLDLLDERMAEFDTPLMPDESTLRKKLKEYEKNGIVKSEKQGRTVLWSLTGDSVDLDSWMHAVMFYSETAPLGVVGSFLRDRDADHLHWFRFKHRYLMQALDSEILCSLLQAIRQKCRVEVTSWKRNTDLTWTTTVYPVRIYISTQDGRQYLLGFSQQQWLSFFRLDNILRVKLLEPETPQRAETGEAAYLRSRDKIWGVSLGDRQTTEHVEMTLYLWENERFIFDRLMREKRCGQIERLDEHSCRFTADVFDAREMIPWVRSFLGRIISFRCSNPAVEELLQADLNVMLGMYGTKGEETAVPAFSSDSCPNRKPGSDPVFVPAGTAECDVPGGDFNALQ